jgi:single-stranded DNA-binding protein
MSVRRHLAHVGANLCAFNTGIAVANLRVAVTQRIQQDGEWRDGDASYFTVTCWRELAAHAVPELAPGRPEVVPVGVRG